VSETIFRDCERPVFCWPSMIYWYATQRQPVRLAKEPTPEASRHQFDIRDLPEAREEAERLGVPLELDRAGKVSVQALREAHRAIIKRLRGRGVLLTEAEGRA
jgi:predicted deacylase